VYRRGFWRNPEQPEQPEQSEQREQSEQSEQPEQFTQFLQLISFDDNSWASISEYMSSYHLLLFLSV